MPRTSRTRGTGDRPRVSGSFRGRRARYTSPRSSSSSWRRGEEGGAPALAGRARRPIIVRCGILLEATRKEPNCRNLIAGEWTDSANHIADINPSDIQDVVGHFAMATREDVQRAAEAARHAVARWADTTPQERSDRLDLVAADITAGREELARQLSREEGKTLREATAEVIKAAQVFRFFDGEALLLGGEHINSIRPSIAADVARSPVGGVGLLTTWHFSFHLPACYAVPGP